jgi:hypothetical protein
MHLEVQLVRTSVIATGLLSSVISLCALPMGAQDKPREEKPASAIPSSAMPPAGLCRVWLKDVPAAQQPAPTDCASAIRKAPLSAKILFGDLQGQSAEFRQPRSTAPGAPGATARMDDARTRARTTVPRNFGPGTAAGAQGANPSRSTPPGARNSTVAPPAPVIRPPATPPPIKPPEKPQS